MSRSSITGGAETAERLRAAAKPLREALRGAVERSALDLVAHVKKDKLSGQVLKVRTGRLRRSINYKMTTDGDSTTATVGTNVAYARRFELGWKGLEQVKSHTRTIKTAFGKALPSPVVATVRAHKRQANQPARSFLVSSLEDLRAKFTQRIESAIKGAAK